MNELLTPQSFRKLNAARFGLSLTWAALLGIWLQFRAAEAAPEQTGSYLGVISALGALVASIMPFAVGPLSDRLRPRFGRAPFLAATAVLALPCLIWFALSRGQLSLAAAFLGVQAALNLSSGPLDALAPDLTPSSHHGRVSAAGGLLMMLGQALGVLMAGVAMQLAIRSPDWRMGAELALALTTATALIIGSMISINQERAYRRAPLPPADGPERLAFVSVLRGPFGWLVLSRAFFNIGFYTVLTFLYFYVDQTLGVGSRTPITTLALFETAIFCAVAVNGTAGRLADRYPRKRLLGASGGLLVIASAGFLLLHSVPQLFMAACLFGAAWGVFSAVDWALACSLTPRRMAATVMAVWGLAFTVPQVLAPLLMGPVADRINATLSAGAGWRWALSSLGIWALMGLITLWRVNEPAVSEGT